ncbi:MAG: DNA polymerase III subunit gamma/tau, partial [Ginsengibacter sp.]
LVLNGFAEFLRNLLVSKDPKVAVLLEVSEGFKQRYLEAASKINDSWLLSALNILNESEINYRLAKNKRLHVELTFIKLAYLKQALDLVNENGQVSKKKQLENVKPVSFKIISPVAVNLIKKEIVLSKIKKPETSLKNEEAKLMIEREVLKPVLPKATTDHTFVATKVPQTKFTKLSSLEKIREKVALENKNNNIVELNEEELYIAWGLYIEKLNNSNKKPIVSNFKSAKLNIVDKNCIEIITETNLQQKFIEAERGNLIAHLQSHFNNRSLNYKLLVIESENENNPKEEVLNTKQQYLKIIEEFPLVKQLKDQLGMELDW